MPLVNNYHNLPVLYFLVIKNGNCLVVVFSGAVPYFNNRDLQVVHIEHHRLGCHLTAYPPVGYHAHRCCAPVYH